MIEATGEAHLWADSFDGSLEDLFDLQDKVAISVAGVIEPTLQAAEIRRSADRPTADLTAYDLYLRALSHAYSWEKKRIVQALVLLEQASERDPNYGPALGLAARCHDKRMAQVVGWANGNRNQPFRKPDWRDFEDQLRNFHPPRFSLRLFTLPQAQAVMATITEESRFTLDSALLGDLSRVISKDGRVSPVDIGITMLALHELARDRLDTELTIQQYRLAGGAEGLLTNYLQQSLERYTATGRDAALLAMLSLADPTSDRRLAEGKSPEQLAEAARSSIGQFRPVLAYLASPAVRILETWSPPESPLEIRYRLPHERLISPLRRLSGQLVAEADRVLLDFQQALQTWIARGKRTRDLLSGRELRQVQSDRDTILAGPTAGERTEFLELSLRGRNRRWVLAGVAGVVSLGLLFWGTKLYVDFQHRQALAGWGLPGDLYDRQTQLQDLRIGVPITQLDWLRAKLHALEVTSNSPQLALALPSSLEKLALHLKGRGDLKGLPLLPGVTTLDLSNSSGLTSLAGLDKLPNLTALNLSHIRGLTSLAGLDKLSKLNSLDLKSIPSTAALMPVHDLPHLNAIEITSVNITSLAWMPKSVSVLWLDHIGQ